MSKWFIASILLLLSACSLSADFDKFHAKGASAYDASTDPVRPGGGSNGGKTNGQNGASQDDPFAISVSVSGPGRVEGENGFVCADQCDTALAPQAQTVLRAVAASDAAFDGFLGPCAEDELDGTRDQRSFALTCTLTATTALAVTAIFAQDHWFELAVSRRGSGEGSVASVDGRIACDGSTHETCAARYVKGTEVTLAASAKTGTFSGWGGACSGAEGCTLTISDTRFVNAVFDLSGFGALIVAKPMNGRGLVESGPPGIVCGEQCSASYPLSGSPTQVLLTAKPEDSSTFEGFSGDCIVQKEPTQCLATVDDIERVSVNFKFKSYPFSVSVAGNGQGKVRAKVDGEAVFECQKPGPCAAALVYGSSVELIAEPAEGSMFAGFWGGGCGSDLSCAFDLKGETRITSSFAVKTYALTTGITGEGTVLCGGQPCASQYVHGSAVSFTAAPAVGWELVEWGGACKGTAADKPCVLSITANTTVLATFAKKRYTLTVTISGTGRGSVAGTLNCSDTTDPCSLTVSKDDPVMLSASAGPGSSFAGWGGACGGSGACNIGQVTGDVMVTATFNTKAQNQTTLIVAKNGKGSVTSVPAGINCGSGCSGANSVFDDGTAIELTASAETGYGAATFIGCDSTNNGKCQIAMNDADDAEDVNVTFAPTNVAVSVTIAGNGSGNVAATGITCATGNTGDCSENRPFDSTYVLTATPSNGSVFAGWDSAGPCASVFTPRCEITIDQSNAVSATFTLKTIRVEATATGGFDGSNQVTRSPTGAACTPASPDCGVYLFGTDINLTAASGTGSTFVMWSGDAASCGTSGTCALRAVAADKSVSANFATRSYSVDVTIVGGGTVKSNDTPSPKISCTGTSGTCSATYPHSSSTVLAASVATTTLPPGVAGLRFTGWSGACTGTSASCSLSNIATNKAVTANFSSDFQYTVDLESTDSAGNNSADVTQDVALVSGPNFSCSGTSDPCASAATPAGTSITLTATNTAGLRFTRWTGATCSQGQTSTSCTFSLSSLLSIRATYVRERTLTVQPTGTGAGGNATLVTATADGRTPVISCTRVGSGCTAAIDEGTRVELSASPPAWASSQGFSGGCSSSTGTCSFIIAGDQTVRAPMRARGTLMFVTDSVTPSTFGPTPDMCNTAASAAGLSVAGPFIPWLSTSGIIAQGNAAITKFSDPVKRSATILRVDGQVISSQGILALLADGALEKQHIPINISENGTLVDKAAVWTGTSETGYEASNCGNWSNSGKSVSGTTGNTSATDLGWTTQPAGACLGSAHIYCIQDSGAGSI